MPRRDADDITERKRAEAALLESEQRVRRLNEHILNMVMVLSHDIRGPIVAIASILKLMLRGAYGKLDQSPANTVQDLLSRCARLLEPRRITWGASIVGARWKCNARCGPAADIIDAVLEELADDITRRDVIDNRLGPFRRFHCISANKTWLKAVYRNLFTNAVKYGARDAPSLLVLSNTNRTSSQRLQQRKPIAEEDREKIFDRFGNRAIEGPAGRCRPRFVSQQGNHPRSRR
jgi:signal transduction histidine kinase